MHGLRLRVQKSKTGDTFHTLHSNRCAIKQTLQHASSRQGVDKRGSINDWERGASRAKGSKANNDGAPEWESSIKRDSIWRQGGVVGRGRGREKRGKYGEVNEGQRREEKDERRRQRIHKVSRMTKQRHVNTR